MKHKPHIPLKFPTLLPRHKAPAIPAPEPDTCMNCNKFWDCRILDCKLKCVYHERTVEAEFEITKTVKEEKEEN